MAKKKRIRDLQIDAAESGNDIPSGDAATSQALNQANEASQYTEEEKLQAQKDRAIREAESLHSAEELQNAADRKRQLEDAEKKRPKSIVDKGRAALKLLTGK